MIKMLSVFVMKPFVIVYLVFIPQILSENLNLNFTGIAIKYGYTVEEHEIVTHDGYILTLFHLPGKRPTPVLLMHGITDSADTFIIRGKDSLVITLAEYNYDVWVGNIRGNKYSRRHVKLNPESDTEFWDYSFHEGGLYDLSATIDYVLRSTGESSLQTIAHSQGSTNHFVLLSMRPEFNEKIKIFIALAPVAFMSNLIPPLSILVQFAPIIDKLISTQVQEFIPKRSILYALINQLCGQGNEISYDLCLNSFLFHLVGFDAKRFEAKFMPVLFNHFPTSTSRKSLVHYSQVARRNRFGNYDYGLIGNWKRYGAMEPPDYDLQRVTTKVALISGRNDPLSRLRDVDILREKLPNVVSYQVMKPTIWNHIDFTWGNDMATTLFPIILELLEKYN